MEEGRQDDPETIRNSGWEFPFLLPQKGPIQVALVDEGVGKSQSGIAIIPEKIITPKQKRPQKISNIYAYIFYGTICQNAIVIHKRP